MMNSQDIMDKPRPIPVVTQPQCKVKVQHASSPKIPTKTGKVKSISTIQRALKAEWQALSESISDVHTVSSIISQDGNVYPIICNVRNRKATAKRNLKTITAHITKIVAILSEYKESFFGISSIDTAFETLCSISHEIQTLTICLERLENKYGYKYEVTSDTAKIKSSCIRYYVWLLSDSARKILLPKDKLIVFFADATGKVFSDIRTLPSAPVGTKKVIPFEIKTQSESNPPKLYMLIRSIEDGQLVGKIEYKLNIAFTNDFDF